MPLTRRGVLFGAAAMAGGLATTSCGLGPAGLPGNDWPDADDVTDALRDLVKRTGRDTFQLVTVYAGGMLGAELLTADRGVQSYTWDRDWRKDTYDKHSILTSPASARLAELPLDRLPGYLDAVKAKPNDVAFDVDYVGKIRVTANVAPDGVGLKLDGSGAVPRFDVDEPAGVRSAVSEIVADYGVKAERIGSFNGFVHVDGNVAGTSAAVRIVRYPRLAAEADIVQGARFGARRLFDAGSFDPTMAVTRKATIAKQAGVKGKVWDWEYRRPPGGGEPLVSYGIGPTGPSTRVWLDRHGKIASVGGGDCPKGTGWCPS